jgi:outer membrane protein assembly factor BamD (BamD/ComL family)
MSLQPVPLPPARPAVPPSSTASLAAERLLLDQARAALSAGNTDEALASTDMHARRFAHPQLGEEREALGIQALVGGGRYDEARARAARFRATWPNSLFLPAVDASIASIP